jgi:hypothetical protein
VKGRQEGKASNPMMKSALSLALILLVLYLSNSFFSSSVSCENEGEEAAAPSSPTEHSEENAGTPTPEQQYDQLIKEGDDGKRPGRKRIPDR